MLTLADYLYLRAYLGGEQFPLAPQSLSRQAGAVTYVAPTASAPGGLIGQSAANAALNVPMVFDVDAIDGNDTVAKGKVAYVWLRDTVASAKTIRAHILKAPANGLPAVSVLDNAPIAFSGVTPANYLGFADVFLQPHPLGGSYGASDLIRIPYTLALGGAGEERLCVFLEALSAFAGIGGATLTAGMTLDRTR